MALGDPKHIINQIGYFLDENEDNLCYDDFIKIDDFRFFLKDLDLEKSKQKREQEKKEESA